MPKEEIALQLTLKILDKTKTDLIDLDMDYANANTTAEKVACLFNDILRNISC